MDATENHLQSIVSQQDSAKLRAILQGSDDLKNKFFSWHPPSGTIIKGSILHLATAYGFHRTNVSIGRKFLSNLDD